MVNAPADLANKTGAHEQFVADDLGVRRIFLQCRYKRLTPTHGFVWNRIAVGKEMAQASEADACSALFSAANFSTSSMERVDNLSFRHLANNLTPFEYKTMPLPPATPRSAARFRQDRSLRNP